MAVIHSCYPKVLLIIVMVHRSIIFINSEEIHLNSKNNGFIGSNGSELECTFTRLKVNDFFRLTFAANSTVIAIRTLSAELKLSTAGKYLEGRVYFDDLKQIAANTTHITSQARMILTDMQCIDDNIYSCLFEFSELSNDGKLKTIISKPSRLIVKVLPQCPSNITIFLHNRKYGPHVRPSTESMTSNNSNLNSLNTSCYAYAVNEQFVEGDSITISCSGEVGNPPQNFTAKAIRSDRTVLYFLDYHQQINSDKGNCSNYQNISVTTNLSAEDNGAVIRCAVTSLINEDGMFIETNPIIVQYSVRTPIIEVNQTNTTSPPVRLTCHSRGNPPPDYTWYILRNNSQLVPIRLYSSTQNLTLYNTTDSGIYRCEVNNTIGQDVFRKSSDVSIEIQAKPLLITKKPDQMSYAEGTPKIEMTCLSRSYPTSTYRWILPDGIITTGNNVVIRDVQRRNGGIYTCLLINTAYSEPIIVIATNKVVIDNSNSDVGDSTQPASMCVAAILGSAFSMLGICLVTSFIVFIRLSRGKKLSGTERRRPMVMASIDDQRESTNYEGINGERTDHHYDELRRRPDQHNNNTQMQPM